MLAIQHNHETSRSSGLNGPDTFNGSSDKAKRASTAVPRTWSGGRCLECWKQSCFLAADVVHVAKDQHVGEVIGQVCRQCCTPDIPIDVDAGGAWRGTVDPAGQNIMRQARLAGNVSSWRHRAEEGWRMKRRSAFRFPCGMPALGGAGRLWP